MNAQQKLKALRKLMKKNRVDALYVPSADPHQSEYLPESWKHRAWLSGFTGSAGELMVGPRKAGLWTDGRYFLQASIELKGSGIDLMRMGEPDTPDMPTWVSKQLKKGQVLGLVASVVSVSAAKQFERALQGSGVKIKYLQTHPVDAIWEDRPAPSAAPMVTHSTRYAGETVASKLKRVRAEMKAAGCKAHVVCALDQVAWLLNVRSDDILFTPVVTAYAVVTDRTATLYVDPAKVTKGAAKALKGKATLKPYERVWDDLAALGKKKLTVWIDAPCTNRRVVDVLKGAQCRFAASPITAMKAVKNAKQIEGIAAAHVRDGVAMVKFLKWLEGAVPGGDVTEIGASVKLRDFRAEGQGFKDESFATISGYAAHGAIIHYSADHKSDVKLRPRGLYLVDSGGQYPDGTTDITRTVALGKPNRRQIECFTRVLMGTIDCTITPFPAGTTGQRQEMFARRALWQIGEDYAHGTGHGVGQYLGVHEGPHTLKNLVTPPLVEGNLLSIEPGHYEAGKFGIRIENLALVTRDETFSTPERTWYRFRAVTLCPIDRRLIDTSLMTRDQVAYLNDYHRRVYRELSPHLDRAHRTWLKQATKAV